MDHRNLLILATTVLSFFFFNFITITKYIHTKLAIYNTLLNNKFVAKRTLTTCFTFLTYSTAFTTLGITY